MALDTTLVIHEIRHLVGALRRNDQWKLVAPPQPFGKLGVQFGMSSFGPASDANLHSTANIVAATTTTALAGFSDSPDTGTNPLPPTDFQRLAQQYDQLCPTDSLAETAASSTAALPRYERLLLGGHPVPLDTAGQKAGLIGALELLEVVLAHAPHSIVHEPLALIFPFACLIRAEITSSVALAALQSLERFLCHHQLDQGLQQLLTLLRRSATPGQRASLSALDLPLLRHLVQHQHAVWVIASTVAQCRFETTSATTDELVLSKMLDVMNAVLQSPGGFLLTDDIVCEMLETTISLSCQMRINPLLRKSAERTLLAWADTLFSNLNTWVHASQLQGDGHLDQAHYPRLDASQPRTRRNSALTLRFSTRQLPSWSTEAKAAGEGYGLSIPVETEDLDRTWSQLSTADPNRPKAPWIDQLTSTPYGSASLRELMRVLITLLNPHDLQYTDTMRLIALDALNRVFETAGHALAATSAFHDIVRQDLLQFIYQIMETDTLSLMAAALRLLTNVFPTFRHLAKTQFQTFLTLILVRLYHPLLDQDSTSTISSALMPETPTASDGQAANSAPTRLAQQLVDHAEAMPSFAYSLGYSHFSSVVLQRAKPLPTPRHRILFVQCLDQLLDVTHDPSLITDLWALYDCDLYSANLWEFLVAFLCQHSLPQLQQDLLQAARAGGALAKEPPTSDPGPTGKTPNSLQPLAPSAGAPTGRHGSFERVAPRPSPHTYPFAAASTFGTSYAANPEPWNVAFRIENRVCLQKLNALLQAMAQHAVKAGSASARSLCDPWSTLLAMFGRQSVTDSNPCPLSDAACRSTDCIPALGAPDEAWYDTLTGLLDAQAQKEGLVYAAAIFNQRPIDGVRFLQNIGYLPADAPAEPLDASTNAEILNSEKSETFAGNDRPPPPPSQYTEDQVSYIAHFLRFAPTLNKALVGEYLSKPKHLPILKAYIRLFDFHGLRLDEALRVMLTQFRLPGESQQIERIVENFAEWYFQSQSPAHQASSPLPPPATDAEAALDGPEVASADAAFVLAYAVIMLNTDQHSRQVKSRMTLADFCRNLRGVNHNGNFSPKYLEAVYQAIKEREIIIPEEHDLVDRFHEIWYGLSHQPAWPAFAFRPGTQVTSPASYGHVVAQRFQAQRQHFLDHTLSSTTPQHSQSRVADSTLQPSSGPEENVRVPPKADAALEGVLFRLSYRTLLMHYSQVLLRCLDDETMRLALVGLFLCSQLALIHDVPTCLEELVSHLCTIAGVLEDNVQDDLEDPQVVANPTPPPETSTASPYSSPMPTSPAADGPRTAGSSPDSTYAEKPDAGIPHISNMKGDNGEGEETLRQLTDWNMWQSPQCSDFMSRPMVALTELSLQLGRDYRGQISLTFLFAIMRALPTTVQSGWALVWRALQNFASADLLEEPLITMPPLLAQLSPLIITLLSPAGSSSSSPSSTIGSPLSGQALNRQRRSSSLHQDQAYSTAQQALDRMQVMARELPENLAPLALPLTNASEAETLPCYFPASLPGAVGTTDNVWFAKGQYSQGYRDQQRLQEQQQVLRQAEAQAAESSLFSTLSSYFLSSYNSPTPSGPLRGTDSGDAASTHSTKSHVALPTAAGAANRQSADRHTLPSAALPRTSFSTGPRPALPKVLSSTQLATKKPTFRRANSSGGSGTGDKRPSTAKALRWDAPVDLLVHLTKSARTAVEACQVSMLLPQIARLDCDMLVPILRTLKPFLPVVGAEGLPCSPRTSPRAIADDPASGIAEQGQATQDDPVSQAPGVPPTDALHHQPAWAYHRGQAMLYEQWLRILLVNMDRLDALWSELVGPLEHIMMHAERFPTFLVQRTLEILWIVAIASGGEDWSTLLAQSPPGNDQEVSNHDQWLPSSVALDLLQRSALGIHQRAPDGTYSLLHHPSVAIPMVHGIWCLWQRLMIISRRFPVNADTLPQSLARHVVACFVGQHPSLSQSPSFWPLVEMIVQQAPLCPETKDLGWQLLREVIGASSSLELPVTDILAPNSTQPVFIDLCEVATHYITFATRLDSLSPTTSPAKGSDAETDTAKHDLQDAAQVLESLLRLVLMAPKLGERYQWDAVQVWQSIERPLLLLLFRACIHPYRPFRQLATARFQQALSLVKPYGRLSSSASSSQSRSSSSAATEPQEPSHELLCTIWSQSFDHVFFPILKQLLTPVVITSFDAKGYEETCTRVVSIISSFFLRHLHGQSLEVLNAAAPGNEGDVIAPGTEGLTLSDPTAMTATQGPFSRVWLTWLDMLIACLNRMEEWQLSKEVVIEHLKNMLLILASLGAFDHHQPSLNSEAFSHPTAAAHAGSEASADSVATVPSGQQQAKNFLWDATWHKMGWVLPNLKEELFPDLAAEQTEPMSPPLDHSAAVDKEPQPPMVATGPTPPPTASVDPDALNVGITTLDSTASADQTPVELAPSPTQSHSPIGIAEPPPPSHLMVSPELISVDPITATVASPRLTDKEGAAPGEVSNPNGDENPMALTSSSPPMPLPLKPARPPRPGSGPRFIINTPAPLTKTDG
ncbi:GDP/GTP exchange factor for ARF [Dimargaris verticillata]|uniref:GDP/GTP exchange factor for ARF n=1 Tax=Dimargaris verticillata TaxID=2761393 RepID=A0A9W8E8R2_9FUNG|nr:GDP/GTP exchange factor for ARF [Dimargaris verticillata]